MFHLREGFFFERLPDGSVRIVIGDGADMQTGGPATIVRETTVPATEFASVVATVSHRGESAETWAEAVEYLTGAGPWVTG